MSNTITKKSLGLTNNQLKIIAMISMFIDHFGLIFFPKVEIFRIIGRLALPIFAYMIAEGCKYTRNRKRYLGIIAVMATVFQIFYFVFMKSLYQGILVVFSLSIAIIYAIDSFLKNKKLSNRILMALIVLGILFVVIGFPIIFEQYGVVFDYGCWALGLPVIVYFAPSKTSKIICCTILLTLMALFTIPRQIWALFTVPLFILYNGERGKTKLKYLFYIFYPLHLVIIYVAYFLMIIISRK